MDSFIIIIVIIICSERWGEAGDAVHWNLPAEFIALLLKTYMQCVIPAGV